MKTIKYEIRYGEVKSYKTITTTDFEQALRMYDKYVKFSENHKLTKIVSLFEKLENGKYWLIKSVTVNPTSIIA